MSEKEKSTAMEWIDVLTKIQKVIDASGIDSDEIYFVMNALHSFNCWDSREERDSWLVQRGIDKAIRNLIEEGVLVKK